MYLAPRQHAETVSQNRTRAPLRPLPAAAAVSRCRRAPVTGLGCSSRRRRSGAPVLVPDGHGDGRVEYLVHAAHLFGAALHVDGAHALGDGAALLGGYGRQALGFEQVDAGFLVAEVGFQTAEDDGRCGAKVEDFGVPLGRVSGEFGVENGERRNYLVHNVLERVRAVDGEADEEEVRFGVGEGPQPVVFFLAGCVPEGELDHLAGGGMGGVRDVVLEDSRYVFLKEVSVRSHDEMSG